LPDHHAPWFRRWIDLSYECKFCF